MPEPKCTRAQLEAELPALKQAGFKCSAIYIAAEIKRRKNAKGKRATFTDKKHEQWREASRRYREKKGKSESHETPSLDTLTR